MGLGTSDQPDGRMSANVIASAAAMDEIHAELERTRPAPTRVSFVHNDLKPDNCQFRPEDPDHVGAIFDWDMTTVGEPLSPMATFTGAWNATGQHAISLPFAMSSTGMPIGIQLVAAYGREDLLLRVGAAMEADIRWDLRRPPVHASTAP